MTCSWFDGFPPLKGAILLLLAFVLPAGAQLTGWGRDHIIKYTPQWKGERFQDGRPKVPDALVERLRKAQITSEEAAWGPLRRAGYLHQWDGNWKILNRHKRLIGRVFTCRYMPGRQEMNDLIEREAEEKGLSQSNVRVMDMLQPGDVVVADHYGNIVNGVFTGDNLAVAIYSRTGNGYVVNGGIRDQEGTEPHGFPVYMRDVWPGTFPGRMLVGINVPIQVGDVTVMPGDIVVGDGEGLTFIPPHLVEEIAQHSEITTLYDDWRKQKFIDSKGSIKPSDLYGAIGMRDPAYQKECKQYVERQMKEKGISAPKDARYCEPSERGRALWLEQQRRTAANRPADQ
jgi:regulator of RNase E activity RraA